ncbi:MAG: hypothetical protein QM739_01105 [Propionivibrio sp.]
MRQSRKIVSHVMQFAAAPGEVFPLLCPVREYEWIEGWQCEMIHSASGVAEAGAVFRTSFAQDGPPDTWVISRYEPPRAIEFVRVNAWRAVHYAIHLEGEAAGHSRWRWTQTLTGLGSEGDALVAAVDAAAFAQKIAALETRLAHFLATGTMLRDNPPSPAANQR